MHLQNNSPSSITISGDPMVNLNIENYVFEQSIDEWGNAIFYLPNKNLRSIQRGITIGFTDNGFDEYLY